MVVLVELRRGSVMGLARWGTRSGGWTDPVVAGRIVARGGADLVDVLIRWKSSQRLVQGTWTL